MFDRENPFLYIILGLYSWIITLLSSSSSSYSSSFVAILNPVKAYSHHLLSLVFSVSNSVRPGRPPDLLSSIFPTAASYLPVPLFYTLAFTILTIILPTMAYSIVVYNRITANTSDKYFTFEDHPSTCRCLSLRSVFRYSMAVRIGSSRVSFSRTFWLGVWHFHWKRARIVTVFIKDIYIYIYTREKYIYLLAATMKLKGRGER